MPAPAARRLPIAIRSIPARGEIMSIEILSRFLLWCALLNYALLIVWFLAFLVMRDFVYRMHNKFFRISVEQFSATNYAGIAFYKILILVFNLLPYIALKIIG